VIPLDDPAVPTLDAQMTKATLDGKGYAEASSHFGRLQLFAADNETVRPAPASLGDTVEHDVEKSGH
jgi:hypothetical protein